MPTPVFLDFPGSSDSKESACNVGDLGSILGLEDPVEAGMATHSSILAWRIPMDRRAQWATVHGVAESDTTERLSTFSTNKVHLFAQEGQGPRGCADFRQGWI